jgi:hypothetical protein
MPSGLGKLKRKDQLDFIFKGATPTAPAALFIAFHTGDPLDDGSAGNEATGGGYARTSFTNNSTNWNAATTPSNDSPSVVTNKLAFTSTTSTGAWSSSTPMTFWSAWDASTAGVFIARGPLTPGQVISGTGQGISIPAGYLTITSNSS